MEEVTDPSIGRTVEESQPYWPPRPSPGPGSPNVLMVLLDDVGFAQLGCYGSDIETPVIDGLAAQGLRYTNFHTTPMCSPTRASLLTGRNSHAVGFGHIVERAAGFPGYNATLPDSAATIAETLRQAGYSTRAFGKWHLMPAYEAGPAGPFDRWPLGRGFERFYGFLGASTDQYRPELYRDNGRTHPGSLPEEGYHLTTDLVDEAIAQLRDLRGVSPHKPFFLYLALGACHTPHQVPREWADRYGGHYDHGWDKARRRSLQRQKELGIMPPHSALAPSNPGVPDWDSLPAEERQLYARMMEIYAGFLSHTDNQLGRLIEFLGELGELDNTLILVMSDNGASAEGGPEGSLDEGLYLNDLPQRAADTLPRMDQLGGPGFYNHYPWGWAQAGNTPFPWYKQFTHAGGIRTPCIVSYPAGIQSGGDLRAQFHHVIDVAPTILELTGVEAPTEVKGVQQMPMHGVSMAYTFEAPNTATRRSSQYFETYGNRAFWRDEWMAVCRLQTDPPGAWPPATATADLDQLSWELYDHRQDPAQSQDLADKHPDKLRELVDEWWADAGRYQVLPIDTRARARRWSTQPLPAGAEPNRWVFHGPSGPYERGVAPAIAGRSFHISADVDIPHTGGEGVLYALGGLHGGYTWYLRDGRTVFEVNLMNVDRASVTAAVALPQGRHRLELDVRVDKALAAHVNFAVDGQALDGGHIDRVLKVAPIGSGRTQVGFDDEPTVSDAYHGPFAFNGDLERVVVTTEPAITTAAEEEQADVSSQ